MEPTNLEFELDGTIYLVERDKDNKIISRDPIDGEGFLQIFAQVAPYILDSDYLKNLLKELDSDQ